MSCYETYMGTPFLFILLSLALYFPFSSSTFDTLSQGKSLSVEKPEEFLISPNEVFSAGFYSVGDNAYSFAVWFTQKPSHGNKNTVVWMANRDQPVNGRRSKLSLLKTGNLILTDSGKFIVWDTNTVSPSAQLHLLNTGNLVLRNLEGGVRLWESFDFPTNTLLPQQPLTKNTELVSSRSQSNFSSGFYKLFFDDDSLLRLLYDGLEISSVYWFSPWLVSWEAERSNYNNSRTAVLNSLGNFSSSDEFTFTSADYGKVLHRRLVIDYDGNLRLYSWEEEGEKWVVSWQADQQSCRIHGICGANSLCSYTNSGRKCSCLPGYKMKNITDWSYGCEPDFDQSCNESESSFLLLSHVEFYGYDNGYFQNHTLDRCKNVCLQLCNCKAFQFKVFEGYTDCFLKTKLLNGYRSSSFPGDLYLRLPKRNPFVNGKPVGKFSLVCLSEHTVQLYRTYVKSHENGTVKFMLWFACGVGGFEIVCIFLVWCFLIRTQQASGADTQGYLLAAATGFRRFTYAELKKATKGFSEEIGRGAGGIVYKGVLSNHRVAAIKRLNEANQGEDEFLAEVSMIGRINHMNLIEMWGYCAEGKHRLLVNKYMENGSLAEKLLSNALDMKKRFEIAVGTAKGLAYLHEECLEWVLHCDVKPQNILLDSNYQPKVADFGLSKLKNRGELENSNFSRIRGTRGYMAPEWISNQSITSKVDVYSYGVVVLEMVTGKGPTMGVHAIVGASAGTHEHRRLVTWVREKKNRVGAMKSWIEEIIDPVMEGEYDMGKMGTLVGVALKCVDEDKDARPSMSEVVKMLLCQENDYL